MSVDGAPGLARRVDPAATSRGQIGVVAVSDADSDAWQSFVAAAFGATHYHDYRWRQLIADVFGHESRYFLARDTSGAVRGVLPLVRLRSRLFGDFLISMPFLNYGGVLADSREAALALADAAADCGRELGVSHVELRHRAVDDLDWPAREDKVSMSLDLPATEEALWDAFPSKLRAQIRRPEKAGATVRYGGDDLVGDFYSVFSRNMLHLGTPVYPLRWFRAILATFAEGARVCVVYLEGKPAAAGFLLTHRSTMEIPWASSLREANRNGVNMLLYWSVLRAAIRAGCKSFDFGRSSKDSGTYRFKEQWGAMPQQLRWRYWVAGGRSLPHLTPSNPKYKLAIAMWQRLPLIVANAIGPHIVKNLP